MKLTPEDVYESVERLQERVHVLEIWVGRLLGFALVIIVALVAALAVGLVPHR